ncbi:MAG: CDP-alcohol phosphatidyltransferase family protein [Bacteroidales bacterium]|nr:CDP-alcohol phosphatidyltransferase family protein [Bacteroidales bacterium]
MEIKKHIPNTITCLNLFSGCIGITFAFADNLSTGAIFIGIAAIFDFLDGFMARILHVKSEIGKQLDSLADILSFGLLPGVIIFMLMDSSSNLPFNSIESSLNPFPYLAFLIPVFSALRLAKFNIDTRQTDSFLGLPTPASALLLGSFPLILDQAETITQLTFISGILSNYYFLLIIILVICYLLVSEIPLFALKFKNLEWGNNKPQYLLIAISVISIVFAGFIAVPIIIVAYLILSLFFK